MSKDISRLAASEREVTLDWHAKLEAGQSLCERYARKSLRDGRGE